MNDINDVTISLSILLGFTSVALGICGLVLKSDCDKIQIGWGCITFERTKKNKQKKKRGDREEEEVDTPESV